MPKPIKYGLWAALGLVALFVAAVLLGPDENW